jgi:N-methylhydantoinase A
MDEASVDRIGAAAKAEGAEAIAICFLHAYQNDAHERRAKDILSRHFAPEVIAISSEVCPEIREYERTSTTVANAYVLPVFARYLARLDAGLREAGVTGPLFLMLSDGGTVARDVAARHPIRLVQSGPAGGVQAARVYGEAAGAADILVLKAAPLGGIHATLALAAEAGLPVVVSSALETSVGLGMGLHLAASLPDLEFDCGLGTAALRGRDPAVGRHA